jgi:hypothetical protein
MFTLCSFVIDRHLVAAISLAGIVLDVMGGLYLAYDLLGGSHGPLRVLTRAVTYTLFFMLGYGFSLGPIFGIVAGGGLGIALSVEYGRMYDKQEEIASASKRPPLLLGLFRGIMLGLAAILTFGWVFGVIFGLLVGGAIIVQYLLGFSPTEDYETGMRPHIRRQAIIASSLRFCATSASGIIAGLLTGEGGLGVLLGFKIGLTVGLVSAIISIFSPLVEWWTDHLPVRRLGLFGTILLLLGFFLQSLQYWVTLLDLPLR